MPNYIPLGCFGTIHNLDDIAAAGYDFIEMHNHELIEMDADQFSRAQARLEASPIFCLVVDNPLPLKLRIASPEFDIDFYAEYLKKGARRTAALGARYWNFGNGFARTIPTDDTKAKDKLMRVFDLTACTAYEYGLQLLVEPLAKSITNQWNTLEETVAFIRSSTHPNLDTFVDMRWQLEERHNFDDLYCYADHIVHAHIDNPFTDYVHDKIRVVPRVNDGYDYSDFLSFIRSDYFHGALSIEALTFSNFYLDICSAMELFHAHKIYSMRQKQNSDQ